MHRDLQPFESMEAVVATPFGLAELEPVDAVGELLEHRPDLLLGQSGAVAPVDAASEREVVGRVTANVEPIGIRKASLVTVGGAEQQHDSSPLGEERAADVDGPGREAGEARRCLLGE